MLSTLRRATDAETGWISVLSGFRRPSRPTPDLTDGVLDLLSDPTVVVDAEGRIQHANRAARDAFGLDDGGRQLGALLAPDHRDGLRDRLAAPGEAESPAVALYADGTEAPVALSIRPLADAEPALFAVGFGAQEPDAEAQAQARSRTLNVILDAIPDSVVAVDRRGRVLFRNQAGVRHMGPADALAKAEHQAADAVMRSGAPAVSEEQDAQGGARLVTRLPVRSQSGVVVGLVAVSRDVTDQKTRRAQLLQQAHAAQAAADAGGQVLATTSHEIRTLMSGVTGMTALLLDTDLDADQRDFVETIRTSSGSLLRVVNDVLDMSKMDAGMMELEHQPYDLRQVLKSALATVSHQAETKGLELAHTVEPDTPETVTGDSGRVQQVLANLLTNAVKFTDAGSVAVHVEADGGSLAFSVRDTGVGIAPDRLAAVFEPFAQADASTARTHGGTGLGLSICRRLADMMGGELTAESAPGGGSVFRFTVALDAPSPSSPQPRAADDSEFTSVFEDVTPTAFEPAALAEATPTPAPPKPAPPMPQTPDPAEANDSDSKGSGRRGRSSVMDTDSMLPSASVLLVEDDPVMQKVTKMTLLRLGYRPTVVDNGSKGVMAARVRPYDVVLMDVMMPIMDGLEATRQIRANPGPHGQPVIVMLTANAMSGDRQAGVDAGCDAYLTKPVSAQDLASTIERAIRDQQPAEA